MTTAWTIVSNASVAYWIVYAVRRYAIPGLRKLTSCATLDIPDQGDRT